MAIFGRMTARQRLRRAAQESLTIPAFSSPIDCTPWVIGGLWPAELSTITDETATVADYLRDDLQRIASSTNDQVKIIRRAGMTDPARQAEEARVIEQARARAVQRVESTLRQLETLRAASPARPTSPPAAQDLAGTDIDKTQVIPAVTDDEPPAAPAESDVPEILESAAEPEPLPSVGRPDALPLDSAPPEPPAAPSPDPGPEIAAPPAEPLPSAGPPVGLPVDDGEPEPIADPGPEIPAPPAEPLPNAGPPVVDYQPEPPESTTLRDAVVADSYLPDPPVALTPDPGFQVSAPPAEPLPSAGPPVGLPVDDDEPDPPVALTPDPGFQVSAPPAEPLPNAGPPVGLPVDDDEPEPPAAPSPDPGYQIPAPLPEPQHQPQPQPQQVYQAPEASRTAEPDSKRLQRLLAFVVRQEPRLNWAVGDYADGRTVLVTDLAHGWIPPGIALPEGVQLLGPERRAGKVSVLLGETTRVLTYAPGDSLDWSTEVAETGASVQPRELPTVDDLGWELGQATHWRDGLPRMVHTLAKAAAAGTGVVDDEVDLLRVHLDTACHQLLAQYPDVDPALLLNSQLLAATEGIVTGDPISANYHLSWFQKLNAPPASQWATKSWR
ncbi:DUF5631 domain-containing protein [Mycobacterium sp.]|uniref:DUF5631 domain-containing protein n=1 Tax=Mycobacterium sp. TaxID=1785 RepID=UPI002CF785F4|nr:DUF5631 domain-containing protein [Mycobacterium sp.]HTQ21266.1 DUF5631 domain-containing protein [Mycobacterium sp.]